MYTHMDTHIVNKQSHCRMMEGQGPAPRIKLFGATISPSDRTGRDDRTAERKPDKIIPCPRCRSMETKFCYFNNYNVNQPRHFCKGCQRYWTAGGALRNVPIGAGRRKAKPNGGTGLPEAYLFDAASGHVQAARLDYLDAIGEYWPPADGGFGQLFTVKKRRCGHNTC